MSVIQVPLERLAATSSQSFESIVRSLESQFGHPDISAFLKTVVEAKDLHEIEHFVNRAVGPSGLMLFTRFSIGDIIPKERGPSSPHILWLVVGNPWIVKQMVVLAPDAAPVVRCRFCSMSDPMKFTFLMIAWPLAVPLHSAFTFRELL